MANQGQDERPGVAVHAGFTLIELILVMFIIALLATLAAPSLSQFAKTSKVQQAAQVLCTAMYHARSEAQRYRQMVAIFVGDDLSKLNPKPVAGILPKLGRVEIWEVKTDTSGPGSTSDPWGNLGSWYPYMNPIRNLTPGTLTLPEGVRVLAGNFGRSWDGSQWQNKFWFGAYNKTDIGEVKRHEIVYARTGGMPGWFDGLNSYFSCLVFDEASGDHLVIWAGEWRASSKPRILPYSLTQVANISGTWKTLTDRREISSWIDQ